MNNTYTIVYLIFAVLLLAGIALYLYKKSRSKIWKNETAKHLPKLFDKFLLDKENNSVLIQTKKFESICRVQKDYSDNQMVIKISAEEIENEELFNALSLWNVMRIDNFLLDRNFNLVIDMGSSIQDAVEVIKIIISKKCNVNINNKIKMNFLFERK